MVAAGASHWATAGAYDQRILDHPAGAGATSDSRPRYSKRHDARRVSLTISTRPNHRMRIDSQLSALTSGVANDRPCTPAADASHRAEATFGRRGCEPVASRWPQTRAHAPPSRDGPCPRSAHEAQRPRIARDVPSPPCAMQQCRPVERHGDIRPSLRASPALLNYGLTCLQAFAALARNPRPRFPIQDRSPTLRAASGARRSSDQLPAVRHVVKNDTRIAIVMNIDDVWVTDKQLDRERSRTGCQDEPLVLSPVPASPTRPIGRAHHCHRISPRPR